MPETYEIVLNIRRYDPDNEKSWIQSYQLETGGILRFTDLFRKINKELDATLAWNSSCEHGQCGSCSLKINGKPMLACELLVENAVADFKTREFLIEPLTIAPVVRDLIVDFDKAYERVNKIKPYIIEPVENGIKVKVGSNPHPMEGEHYIEWIEIIDGDKTRRHYLNPGENPETVFQAQNPGVTAREYCNVHGLWKS